MVLIVSFSSHAVKLKNLSSTGLIVIVIENNLGWPLIINWVRLEIILTFSIVFCSLDIAAGKLLTPGVSELDRAKVTHFQVFEVRSIFCSCHAEVLFDINSTIDHCSGTSLALIANEAVDSELITLSANVVSLHLKFENVGTIIGAWLEEIKAHARLGPIRLVFSILAGGKFGIPKEIELTFVT